MDSLPGPLNERIEWCQRERLRARTWDEHEGWVAEITGLCDAFRGSDRTTLARVCYPSHVDRYQLGFRDGQAIMRGFPTSPVVYEQNREADLSLSPADLSEQPTCTSPSDVREEFPKLCQLLSDAPANQKDECSTNMPVPQDADTQDADTSVEIGDARHSEQCNHGMGLGGTSNGS